MEKLPGLRGFTKCAGDLLARDDLPFDGEEGPVQKSGDFQPHVLVVGAKMFCDPDSCCLEVVPKCIWDFSFSGNRLTNDVQEGC